MTGLLPRRELLWACAAGAAATLTWAPARAATPHGGRRPSGSSPRRFVGIFTPHGMAAEYWRPGPGFDLQYPDCSLRPFDDAQTYGRSFRDRLLVLEGIDLAAGIAVGTTGHDAARVILTGSGADGKGPSIDQYLAVGQQLGLETPLSSLVLGIGDDQSAIGSNLSYGVDSTPIPKLIDPSVTYAELFGAPLSGMSEDELRSRRRQGRSALDLIRADLARLRKRAPSSERSKLELHHDALREIEKRLAGFETTCEVPPAPPKFGALRSFGGGEVHFEQITELQIDLLARAFACDLTRFATLFLADLSRTGHDTGLPTDVHNDVAHRYDARRDGHPGTPGTWLPLARQNAHSYGQVARLAQRLDEAGVFDETLIYASSDMGDPARHSSRNVPTVLLGATPFSPGRFVSLRCDEHCTERNLIPNNRLLVSICRSFGVRVDRFGDSSHQELTFGPLEIEDSPPSDATSAAGARTAT